MAGRRTPSGLAGRPDPGRWLIAALVAGLLLSAFLHFYALDARSLWDDEAGTVGLASAPTVAQLLATHATVERQPPAHWLLLHYWLRLAGDSEIAARFPFALLSTASAGLVGWLGWRLFGARVAVLAVFLYAISPFVMLYGRMARYYGLASFLALLSTALLVESIQRRWPPRRALPLWLLYALSAFGLLMTTYNGAGAMLAQATYVAVVAVGAILAARRKPAMAIASEAPFLTRVLVPWALAQVAIAAGFGYWALANAERLRQIAGTTDPFVRQSLATIPLDFLFPLYAYGLGETLFPWQPFAILGAITLTLVGGTALLRWRHERSALLLLVLGVACPVTVTALSFVLVARDQSFNTVASKSPGAEGCFLLLLAVGLAGLRPALRAGALGVMTLVSLVAITNYFAGEQFVNPSYAVPSREMLRYVDANSQPGDLIVAESPLLTNYYYRPQPSDPPIVAAHDSAVVQQALASGAYDRVWLLSFGGFGNAITSPMLRDWVIARYRPVFWWGGARQDPTYLALKARLQHTEGPEYRATIELFSR